MLGEPTILVKFGDDVGQGDRIFEAVLDKILNVDSAGEEKTEFAPNDDIYFTMHYDSTKLRIDRIAATDGEIFTQNRSIRSVDIDQLFEDDEEVTIAHLPRARPTITWYAFNGISSEFTWRYNTLKVVDYPCFGRVQYDYNVQVMRWRAPNVELVEEPNWPVTWPIAIVIYVEAVEGT